MGIEELGVVVGDRGVGGDPGGGVGGGVGGDLGGEVGGLVRRVRRVVKVSQRELAQLLGVSQSAVAKWETGRTCPSAGMLVRVLAVAGLSMAAVSAGGERVGPMRAVAVRDAGGRRYPAHAFVWAQGWWVPEGSETTAWYLQVLGRSAELELPRVRYSRWWQLGRAPTLADVVDHPSWGELVAEARVGWRPRRRVGVVIPEWAFADTRKSRNRWPDEFRAHARTVRLDRRRRLSCPRPDVGNVASMTTNGIEVGTPPSGSGCVECEEVGGWWVHLRRCAQCGHVGCCDTSPAQHATAHFRESGHPVIQSFEPGESWFWDYATEQGVDGPPLAPPTSHPVDQPAPGPAGRVPDDWRDHVHK